MIGPAAFLPALLRYGLPALGVVLLVLAVRARVHAFADHHRTAGWEAGVEAMDTAWKTAVADHNAEVRDYIASLGHSRDAYRAAMKRARRDLRAAREASARELAERETTIANLRGQIDATPPLDTPGARERLPDHRLQLHARADRALADNRARERGGGGDPAGPAAPDAAAGAPVQAGVPALAARPGLSLGGTEERAAILAAELAGVESRLIALRDWALQAHADDLARWEAEQARREAVRGPPDAALSDTP